MLLPVFIGEPVWELLETQPPRRSQSAKRQREGTEVRWLDLHAHPLFIYSRCLYYYHYNVLRCPMLHYLLSYWFACFWSIGILILIPLTCSRKSAKLYEHLRKPTKTYEHLWKSTIRKARKINENLRKSMKSGEHVRKSGKINEHLRKSTKIGENPRTSLRKSTKIMKSNENKWKSTKIYENPRKSTKIDE